MLNISHAIILAIVQGLTEFLPISSSAHLILVPILLHWPDQGMAFDVIIHLGTLVAVLLYFRKELSLMLRDCLRAISSKQNSRNTRLAWALIFATIPVAIFGAIFSDLIAHYLRSALVIAITTIVFGVLLGIATLIAKQKRDEYSLKWRDVLFIGLSQAISLIPGVSRSGITLTAGLYVGMTRVAAARFSFLMSIPVIMIAATYQSYKLAKSPLPVDFQGLFVGFIFSAISGYICIDLFLKIINKYGVMPFVIYRLILGIILLAIFI